MPKYFLKDGLYWKKLNALGYKPDNKHLIGFYATKRQDIEDDVFIDVMNVFGGGRNRIYWMLKEKNTKDCDLLPAIADLITNDYIKVED